MHCLPSFSRAPRSCAQLQTLTERLHKVNEAIAQKIAARDDYDKTVRETESAYMKILESSQTLLTVLKRESVNLTKKKQSSSDGGDDE
jgi:Sjoegren syndrome nuclear autoantigen 1